MTVKEYLGSDAMPRRHIWRRLYVSRPIDEYHYDPKPSDGESLTESTSGVMAGNYKKPAKPSIKGIQKTGLLTKVSFDKDEEELEETLSFLRGY